MRRIGDIAGESNAKVLSDYLYVKGVGNQVEAEQGDVWSVWVHSEDDLSKGMELMADFTANPGAARFRDAVREAAGRRAAEEEQETSYRKKIHNRDETLRNSGPPSAGILTLTVIGFCIFVYFLDKTAGPQSVRSLYISEFVSSGSIGNKLAALLEIRHGQVWRLFTPMFLHFGILHIVFNLTSFYVLGSTIEQKEGAGTLLIYLLVVSAFSNVAQYLVSGPRFGGLSGVVYALLGYVWIRGRFDARSGYMLTQSTVNMMLIWFGICLIGLIPNVANTVHAVGLGFGMAWGYMAAHLKPN